MGSGIVVSGSPSAALAFDCLTEPLSGFQFLELEPEVPHPCTGRRSVGSALGGVYNFPEIEQIMCLTWLNSDRLRISPLPTRVLLGWFFPRARTKALNPELPNRRTG